MRTAPIMSSATAAIAKNTMIQPGCCATFTALGRGLIVRGRGVALRFTTLARVGDVESGALEKNRRRVENAGQLSAARRARVIVRVVEAVANLGDLPAVGTLIIVERHVQNYIGVSR